MSNKVVEGAVIWLLFWITFWILSLVGWVMNLVAIIHSDFSPLTPVLVLRLVGIFVVPIGAFCGWFA